MKPFWKKKKTLPEVPMPPKEQDTLAVSSKEELSLGGDLSESQEETSKSELDVPSFPSFEEEKLNQEELSTHNFSDMEMEAPPLPEDILENIPVPKKKSDEFSSLFSQPLQPTSSDNKKEFRKKVKQTPFSEYSKSAAYKEIPKPQIKEEDLFAKGELDKSIFGEEAFAGVSDTLKPTKKETLEIPKPVQYERYRKYKEEKPQQEDKYPQERELFITMHQFKLINELSKGVHESSINVHDTLFRLGQLTEDIAVQSMQIQSKLENIHETLWYIDKRLFGR